VRIQSKSWENPEFSSILEIFHGISTGGQIGVPKQWSGGHVSAPKQYIGSELFLYV